MEKDEVEYWAPQASQLKGKGVAAAHDVETKAQGVETEADKPLPHGETLLGVVPISHVSHARKPPSMRNSTTELEETNMEAEETGMDVSEEQSSEINSPLAPTNNISGDSKSSAPARPSHKYRNCSKKARIDTTHAVCSFVEELEELNRTEEPPTLVKANAIVNRVSENKQRRCSSSGDTNSTRTSGKVPFGARRKPLALFSSSLTRKVHRSPKHAARHKTALKAKEGAC